MFKMEIPVIVQAVKPKKDSKDIYYADFIFTGGSANIQVSDEKLIKLLPVGDEVIGVFQMNIRQCVMFGRPSTGFFPDKLIDVKKGQGTL